MEIPEHHAPVVDRALFDAVQRALEARGRAAGRRRYSGSYVWSGKVVCAMRRFSDPAGLECALPASEGGVAGRAR
ncbi:MAG: hypothetical protein ACLSAP_02265 [Oscillospiraceae bacterium]